ncbi:TPA: NrdH-redoxin [Candidatus Berkelbacteria bacterium]|uniref:Glutaredoxin-like protein n=1 Tax=Berkelbacteria bacterium GW2011_GWE1_39_12 TaxID=1618337 RepID=A0A0G4B4I2_9BACT|nr:MAG: glutaredoxin-like protein [Berkelbacteria bacterium GW2011_GWE1_39_12]HBO60385.1 NrdH-redoxin [Candidatus Berkelbacteria bacterium]
MEETSKKQSKVIVFSTPTCPWCVIAKQYLNKKGIEFENKDVSIDHHAADEMVEKSGQMGVPQLWIDDEIVVGFDQSKINKLLGL